MIVCPDCDNKLDAFYRFRIDSRQAQLEFANIIKSHYPLHYGNNNIEIYRPMEPMRSSFDESMYINVENMYSSTPAPSTIQSTQEYEAQCSYHDLHSLMDEDNQNDQQSLVMSSNQGMYVHQPHCSPLSPATPIYVPAPQITPQTDNCYQQSHDQVPIVKPLETQHYVEPQIIDQKPTIDAQQYTESHQIDQKPNLESYIHVEPQQMMDQEANAEVQPTIPPDESDSKPFPSDDNDSFTYSDYDEECQSVPSDRINVENAIDMKIEEFIQNKGTKAPKICTVCNKLFRTNHKLRVHMESHSERKMFICEAENCGKSFKSKIGLKEHSGVHDSNLYNYTCEVCSKKFVLNTYFIGHKRIHDKPKLGSFPCTMCPKRFNSKQNLVDHENVHLGLKFFKCEICTKSFNTKTHLDVHVKSHWNSDSTTCHVCNKLIKSKKYLKNHLKSHDDDLKEHICEVCNKKFMQMSDLKKHSRTHTKEKCYICET